MDAYLRKLASSNQTILITGETGTGKSHLAHEIHKASPRRPGKFVTINLATLSENLIESELFGHEKGAFSGADFKRIGKLESANGGTVFLDEIGELPLRLQTKLLEALNSHVISPVGSNREIMLDIRVITATNRDLKKMVAQRQFREDLYFRINTFLFHLPTLSSEPDRITSLAKQFCRSAAERSGRNFSELTDALISELKNYSWPGNIRELKNCMEFAVAMSGDGPITPEYLPAYVRQSSSLLHLIKNEEISTLFPTDYREAKHQFERSYLNEMLLRNKGKINVTATQSGLSKVTLIEKIRRYRIDVNRIKLSALTLEEK